MREIYNDIVSDTEEKPLVIRTKNALTISTSYPKRNIQIILKLFQSATEVISNFDLDCVCVAYDGNDVVCLPRFCRSLSTRMNFVDINRFHTQTVAHDARILKYAKRGFGACLLNQVELISTGSHIPDSKSLAKLVTLKYQITQKEGYESTYLPYGPKWNPKSLEAFLKRKNAQEIKKLIAKKVIKSEKEYQPFFIYGSLHYVLDTGKDDSNFSRKIQWLSSS